MTPWLSLLTAIEEKANMHGITMAEFRMAATILEMKRPISHAEALGVFYLRSDIEVPTEETNEREDFIDSVSNLVDKGFLSWNEDELQIAFTGEMFVIEIYQIAQSSLTRQFFDPNFVAR